MQIRLVRNHGIVVPGPLRTATLAPVMKRLFTTLCLLSSLCVVGTALAQTAAPVPGSAPGTDCVPLQDDHQLIRKNADRTMLMRNGTDHYLLHFASSCSSAAFSKKLTLVTRGNEGQLCGARATKLRTDSSSCDVDTIEPITAEAFASRAKR